MEHRMTGVAHQDSDDLHRVPVHRRACEKTLVAAMDRHGLRTMDPIRAGTPPLAYPTVSVVVPTRNEARNLEIILPAIAAVRPAVHEIIVVDGHSTDGSLEVARRVLPSVKIITQTRVGKGNAMACGFAAVTGDIVVMFDADGSADPAEIPRFVEALVAGADFANGSCFVAGGGSDDITLLRKAGNFGLNGVANALFGTSYTDLCYGYNAFWADVLSMLELAPRGCAGARRQHGVGRRLRDRDRAQLPDRRGPPDDCRSSLGRAAADVR
jgi:glycosyltransferase involved in cell wall biosynthesis